MRKNAVPIVSFVLSLICNYVGAAGYKASDADIFNYVLQNFEFEQQAQWGLLKEGSKKFVLISDESVIPYFPDGIGKLAENDVFKISTSKPSPALIANFQTRNLRSESLKNYAPVFPKGCCCQAEHEIEDTSHFELSDHKTFIRLAFPSPGRMLPIGDVDPAVVGIVRLSLPAFDKDETSALLYFEYNMQPFGDAGSKLILLERKDYGEGWDSYETNVWDPDFIGSPNRLELSASSEDLQLLSLALNHIEAGPHVRTRMKLFYETGETVDSQFWYDPDRNPPVIPYSAIQAFYRRNKESVTLDQFGKIGVLSFLVKSNFKQLLQQKKRYPDYYTLSLPGFDTTHSKAVLSIRSDKEEIGFYFEKVLNRWQIKWSYEYKNEDEIVVVD